MSDPALQLRFEVKIDGLSIGSFTSCEGLEAEYEVKPYEEGGENGFVHKLPGRLKYQAIRLSRAIDADSGKLASWFSSLRMTVRRQTAAISAYDGNNKKVAQWNLIGVYPSKWTGPSFSSDGNAVAKETLELVHNGFLGTPGGDAGMAIAAGASVGGQLL